MTVFTILIGALGLVAGVGIGYVWRLNDELTEQYARIHTDEFGWASVALAELRDLPETSRP